MKKLYFKDAKFPEEYYGELVDLGSSLDFTIENSLTPMLTINLDRSSVKNLQEYLTEWLERQWENF
jgi:hypothetical protein